MVVDCDDAGAAKLHCGKEDLPRMDQAAGQDPAGNVLKEQHPVLAVQEQHSEQLDWLERLTTKRFNDLFRTSEQLPSLDRDIAFFVADTDLPDQHDSSS